MRFLTGVRLHPGMGIPGAISKVCASNGGLRAKRKRAHLKHLNCQMVVRRETPAHPAAASAITRRFRCLLRRLMRRGCHPHAIQPRAGQPPCSLAPMNIFVSENSPDGASVNNVGDMIATPA